MEFLPKIKRKCHPQEKANFLSQAFFLYTIKLLTKAYRHEGLKASDLHDAPSTLKSKKLGDQIETLWRNETKQKKTSLFILLLKNYGLQYFFLGLSQFLVKTILLITRPLAVAQFSSFIFRDGEKNYATSFGFLLFLLVLLESLYDQWYTFKLQSLEIRIRATFLSLFYRKILKLSSLSSEDTSVGEIVNLITKDVDNLEKLIRKSNQIWISALQGVVLFYFLFNRIGFVVFFVLITSIIFLPMQIRLAMKSTKIKTEMLQKTDDRLEQTKEIFWGIRTVKLYAWEKFLNTRLDNLRWEEIQLTSKIFFLKFIIYINGTSWTFASFFLWMAVCTAFGIKMTSESVFFMFDIHRTINNLLIISIPLIFSQLAQTLSSIKRINTFLAIREQSSTSGIRSSSKISLKNVYVTISKQTILRKINLEFDNGLVLITGTSSSGKSLLLKTILRECELSRGEMSIEGTLSYASQEPWLFPSTIRQNILFGEDFNEKRYNQVLTVCGLIYDFQELKNGDQTVIIESNGMHLSRGQRVRINLARAVYRKSDIYLLDDPLACLDPDLGKMIFEECIRKFLRNKLVILVTQDTKFLAKCLNSVTLDEGEVSSRFYQKKVEDDSSFIDDEVSEETPLLTPFEGQNVFEETTKIGEIKGTIYKKWVEAGGVTSFISVITFLLFLPMVMKSLEKSTTLWSLNEEKIETNITRISHLDFLNKRKNLICLLITVTLIILITNLLSAAIFLNFIKNTSIKLHKFLIVTILNSSLCFFESKFSGEVLNRFSRDLFFIDEVIPFLLFDLFKTVVPLLSSIFVIIKCEQILLVFLPFLFLILTMLKKYYLYAGRSLKRLEASCKSPVVGYFISTLAIKDQKCEEILKSEFDRNLDLHISASYTYLCTTGAFSLSLRLTCSMFFGLIVSWFLLVSSESFNVDLIIFETLLLIQFVNQFFLKWAVIETNMTSVERILEFTEADQKNRGFIEEWPKLGEVKFENVSLANNQGRIYLLANFVVQPKQKIGITGRTGSGKTSLIRSLLRLHDFEGRISVNGIDVKNFSLQTLRSNISVIPQEPFIFKNTVRENLDPYCKHSDKEIWELLETVGLKKFLWDLNVNIYETFIPFSSRLKQLLCLAKCVLEKHHIVVIDDFFVNVDEDVENLICDFIRTVFLDCSMLIVTNNSTILSCCDDIITVNNEKLIEFKENKDIIQHMQPTIHKN